MPIISNLPAKDPMAQQAYNLATETKSELNNLTASVDSVLDKLLNGTTEGG